MPKCPKHPQNQTIGIVFPLWLAWDAYAQQAKKGDGDSAMEDVKDEVRERVNFSLRLGPWTSWKRPSR